MFAWNPRPLALIALLLGSTAAAAAPGKVAPAPASEGVRLYALDCGRFEFKDMGMFADTGEYDGKEGKLLVSCFLIKHPRGVLLWDTGIGDKIAAMPRGLELYGGLIHESVPVTLASQLKKLGLSPTDITYVAFSHLHVDHVGNSNLFTSSTWILNSKEIAWATTTPPPVAVEPQLFSGYKQAKVHMIDGDHDVFGDGSVKILRAPGHTPGHSALLVKLKRAGVVVLSGDLYHLRENRKLQRVPAFNDSRADTLASMGRIEKIVDNAHARLVIQHDTEDLEELPKLPACLE